MRVAAVRAGEEDGGDVGCGEGCRNVTMSMVDQIVTFMSLSLSW